MSFSRRPRSLCTWLTLVVGLVASVNQLGGGGAATTTKEFPSLWSCLYEENCNSYHVLYQLEMENSDELLTVEEWADYNKSQFRIDLISTNQLRTSYLLDGQTGEMFRYKPYTCDELGANSTDFDVLSKLFIGWPWSRDAATSESALKAYGLGPFWLRAASSSSSMEFVERNPNTSADEEHEFGDQFDEFRVELKQNLTRNQVPHKLRFFFPRGERNFVESIDWLLADEHDGHSLKVVAQLRVLLLDHRLPEARIFQLPIGYGCKRRRDKDSDINIESGLTLLHAGLPSQVVFDITFSLAQDDVTHSWTSRRYSMHMTRLTRPRRDDISKTESFIVNNVQARTSEDRSRLKRVKRVWWAPDSSGGEATVYEIDQETGACEILHRDVRDQIVLGYLAPAGTTIKQNDELRPTRVMVLSVDQISFLFADNAGYHLIDAGKDLGHQRFRDRYYEKRLANFQLTTDGSTTWEGPVSIVKRISSYWQSESPKREAEQERQLATGHKKLTLLTDFQTTLTILFYSRDYDQLQYKVVVQLLGNHEVSYAYAHEQLDISACFDSSDEDSNESTGDERREVVTLKYPLSSPRLARELPNERESILSALYVNLFDRPTSWLSPLQLNDIQLSFDLFDMHVQFTILELPLNQLFQLTSGLKLTHTESAPQGGRNAILQTTSSNAALCSQHCEHYNCFRFSYEPNEKLCQVELVPAEVRTVACDTCKLFTYVDRRSSDDRLGLGPGERPHFSAGALVAYLEQLVERQLGGGGGSGSGSGSGKDDNWKNPLEITVELAESSPVTLRPSSLRHELESMNEYELELNEEAAAAAAADGSDGTEAGKSQPVVRQLGGRQLKLQFMRLFENRYLKQADEDEVDKLYTFEECEQFCQLHDCRSFSYCQGDESCRLSSAHNEDYLLRSATSESPTRLKCNVYALDYLSKFEPFGSVPPPVVAKASVEGATPRACASHCMDLADFTCQGFYHCPMPGGKANVCHLMNRHSSSLRGQELEQAFVGTTSNSEKVCTYYSRSYLAQFDKYFGKRLSVTGKEPGTLVINSASDPSECARKCTELSCLAFDSCPGSLEIGANSQTRQRKRRATGKQSCKLLFKGVKRSQLEPERRCTTFVLSDRSHFNAKKMALVQDQSSSRLAPNQEASLAENQADQKVVLDEQLARLQDNEPEMRLMRHLYERESIRMWHPSSGHWLARFFSLALGATFGCLLVFTWNEAYARGWFQRLVR